MLKRLLTSTLVLTAASAALAGGYSGSSGDMHDPMDDWAWYLGDAPIRYCIEIDPQFGRTADEVQKEFESVVQQWKSYVSERSVYTEAKTEFRLNFNFQYAGSCQGSEDLRLIMGLEPEEVVKAKAKFDRPFAFSIRQRYDESKARGQGFIWLARHGALEKTSAGRVFPNWQRTENLHGALLHELGHVLGNGHIPGTIMTAELGQWLQMADSVPSMEKCFGRKLTQIESERILHYSAPSPAIHRNGIVAFNENEQSATFKRLMGRRPVGKISAEFEWRAFEEHRLTLRDSNGSHTFNLVEQPGYSSVTIGFSRNVFVVRYGQNGQDHVYASAFSSPGGTSHATTKTVSGETLLVDVDYNTNIYGPFQLRYLDGKQWQSLFFTDRCDSPFQK